jgi:hypothetical protein
MEPLTLVYYYYYYYYYKFADTVFTLPQTTPQVDGSDLSFDIAKVNQALHNHHRDIHCMS